MTSTTRRHGMGSFVEYAGRIGKPLWLVPPRIQVELHAFSEGGANAPSPDEIFEMTFAKENAAEQGFNRWTINGVAYPMTREPSRPRSN